MEDPEETMETSVSKTLSSQQTRKKISLHFSAGKQSKVPKLESKGGKGPVVVLKVMLTEAQGADLGLRQGQETEPRCSTVAWLGKALAFGQYGLCLKLCFLAN